MAANATNAHRKGTMLDRIKDGDEPTPDDLQKLRYLAESGHAIDPKATVWILDQLDFQADQIASYDRHAKQVRASVTAALEDFASELGI